MIQNVVPSSELLSIPMDNFGAFKTRTFDWCMFRQTEAANQILTNTAVAPEEAPNANDIITTKSGLTRFKYSRRNPSPAEVIKIADGSMSEEELPLTVEANRDLKDDKAAFTIAKEKFTTDDKEVLLYLSSRLSPQSFGVCKSSDAYKAFVDAPIGTKSFLFWKCIVETHLIGDAHTKYNRALNYLQGSLLKSGSLEQYIIDNNDAFAMFSADFGDKALPTHMNLAVFNNCRFIKGLGTSYSDHTKALLAKTPDGIFTDLESTIHSYQTYKANQLLSNPSFVDSSDAPVAFVVPTAPTPKCCTYCLQFGKRENHPSETCIFNDSVTNPKYSPAALKKAKEDKQAYLANKFRKRDTKSAVALSAALEPAELTTMTTGQQDLFRSEQKNLLNSCRVANV
jgi:hypothetical protein